MIDPFQETTLFSTANLAAIAERARKIKGARTRFNRGSSADAMLAAAALATKAGSTRYLFATANGYQIEDRRPDLFPGRKYTAVNASGYMTIIVI